MSPQDMNARHVCKCVSEQLCEQVLMASKKAVENTEVTHTHKLFICIGEVNTGVRLHHVCLPCLSVLDRSWFGLQFTRDSVSFSLLQIMKESAARTLFTNRKTRAHTHTDTLPLEIQ